MDRRVLQRRAREVIDGWAERLIALSHDLHAHPELAWNEHRSARACAELLTEAGIATAVGVHGLPTAFRGDAGSDGPLIVVCCEYDALPGLGHACAHNVIAAAGAGAAIGLAAVAGLAPLRVRVLGTPAEEDTGGKIDLLADGAFADATAALMVHAYARDVADFVSFAADDLTVRCASPDHLAAVVAAIDSTRAGAPAGVVVRAPTVLDDVTVRVAVRTVTTDLLDAGRGLVASAVVAAAPGVAVAGLDDRCYAAFEGDAGLAAAYRRNAEVLGRGPFHGGRADACTDMGNVSLTIPSLHAMVAIGDAFPHSPEFEVCAASPAADRAVVDAAIAMAWTGIDAAGAAVSRV